MTTSPIGSASGHIEKQLRHIDHLIERIGETRIGFVSDRNGGPAKEILRSVTSLVERAILRVATVAAKQ